MIISLDGCRWDYPEMYDTPFLDHLAKDGVKAIMQPSFPSVTFPNHYTLATGLVPDHHGIIANKFLDKKSGLVFSLGDKTRMVRRTSEERRVRLYLRMCRSISMTHRF